MWHDNKTNIDLLDFEHLVAPITQIIHNRTLLPCTIGVYGDWGSGKSSLLKMVEEDLKEDEDVLCISFNGWLFEDYDDAKSALMGTILDEIESKRTITEKGKDIIGRLFKQIDWMRFAGMATKQAISFATMGPAGLALTGLSDFSNILEKTKDLATEKANSFDEKQIAEVISKSMGGGKRLRKGIREFHCDFGKLLEETKIKTLVVFIDDLDRCTPDTIIETLEAIRLFLFAEQTVFVIGADERLVKYAVRRRFPEIPGESVDIGREYLEKLIQFPIRIPQLSRFEIETYINLLFTKLNLQDQKDQFEDIRSKVLDRKKESLYEVAFNYGVAKEITPDFYSDLEESLMLSEQIAPILASGLNGNPRQCKRFLNTLLMRIEMAKTREINLEKRKLAKLMILEYFKPEWFKELANLQSNNEGRPEKIKKLEEFLLQKEHPKDEDNAEEQDEPLDIEKNIILGFLILG
ncbi:KAP family P-loop NTPase fold protein [Orenia marismortui]|uniref:KAP family P-loop NTPase fold protein n=1 Tax=Orenia marismortui TaxID=46469 RepID=UPI00039D8D63|nr:P-loop NTPase fold protein [Orenia marismortui]